MTNLEADKLVTDAFSKGVGWAGVNAKKGRPMLGCDPSDPVANQAFNEVMEAFKSDPVAMDRALFQHILDQNLPNPERGDWVVVRSLGKAS
ncbi:MAG: hypothetical protein EVA65_16455 [Oceanococcus sp.]|nr:MAG: hypothetical protein EVA65_16455 [Oceanococcus sp.]